MNAYITIGASSSGKSTFAEAMVKTSQGKTVNINRDDARRSLFQIKSWKGYNFSKERENLVTEVNRGKIKAACEAGKNVIISDTNLNEYLRYNLINELKSMKFDVHLIWFPVPREELDRRNATRGGWAVNSEVLDRMVSQFDSQFEKRDEKDTVFNVVINKKYTPDVSLPKAVIFDTDGTLAEKNDRNAFDWDKVGEDTPRENVVMLANLLKQQGYKIINVSGRDGVCMKETADWYAKHGIPNDAHFQRAEKDQRPDNIIKAEIFWRDIAPNFNVCFCVDDRDQVVKTWRDMGLECWQVQSGDF